MDVREALIVARARLDNDAVQYDGSPASRLWKDPELIAFLREAQREAAYRAKLIYDESSTFTTIPIVAAQNAYPLHWSIFEVRRVAYNDNQVPLCLTTIERLDNGTFTDDYGWRRLGRWRTRTESRAREFYLTYTPRQQIQLTTFPIPQQTTYVDDGGTDQPLSLKLGVYRHPIWPVQRESDRLEIADRWHERLIDWVLYRCYSKRDSDTYSPEKAQDNLSSFAASFGPRDTADQDRRKFENAPAQTRGWGM